MTTLKSLCFILLWVATVTTALLGAGFVLAPRPTLALMQALSLAGDAHPDVYVDFVYGVLGAVMIGWMALFSGLLIGPIRSQEPWAIRLALGSILVWFGIDTAMSWYHGQGHNVALNILSAVCFVVPLAVLSGQPLGAKRVRV